MKEKRIEWDKMSFHGRFQEFLDSRWKELFPWDNERNLTFLMGIIVSDNGFNPVAQSVGQRKRRAFKSLEGKKEKHYGTS